MADAPLTDRLAHDVDGVFEELVRTHQDDVFTALVRLTGSRADAEDLAQDSFVRAYKALLDYPPTRIRTLALKPWLLTIALNTGRNHFRAAGRRPSTTPLTDEERGPRVNGVEIDDTLAEWGPRLLRLGEGTRAAVVLRHVVGLTTTETAETLGVPEGTVKARVARGLDQLRDLLTMEVQR
jgi:RNA polymerase sigma-70 factor (ECF subfamily)